MTTSGGESFVGVVLPVVEHFGAPEGWNVFDAGDSTVGVGGPVVSPRNFGGLELGDDVGRVERDTALATSTFDKVIVGSVGNGLAVSSDRNGVGVDEAVRCRESDTDEETDQEEESVVEQHLCKE